MLVDAKQLVEAVEAIGLVPPRAGIVSSEFIRVRYADGQMKLALAAEAYGEVGVPGEGKLGTGKPDWTFWVDRTLFEPFVMASKEHLKTPFKFLGSDKLVVKCGRRRARFNKTDPMAGYATPPSDKGVRIKLNDAQKQMLQLASKYATQDPTLADYNCVYLKEGTGIMAASHSAIFHVLDKSVAATVPLPLLLVTLMTSKALNVAVVKKSVRLAFANGAVCQLMNQKAKNGFPAKTLLKQLDEAKGLPSQFTIKAPSLLNALKRQEAIISASVKRDLVAKLHGDKGDKWISITCAAPQGKFTEKVLLLKPLKDEVNCEMMMAQLLPLAEHAAALVEIEVKFNPDSNFYIAAKGLRLIVSRKASE